tara:strand:- start:433 stop:1047 length:615 start_codon:yes stop_codon:yes gene_type:complete
MGFLDNTSITVDAILTKKGRQLLAEGKDKFKITKFALADDEVDYNLWDTSHPNGSAYFGAVLENMPVLEAFTDETQVMRYKLVTLGKNTTQMPSITIQPGNSDMNVDTQMIVTATTKNGSDSAYQFTLSDSDIAWLSNDGTFSTELKTSQTGQRSVTVTGTTQATLLPKSLRTAKSAKLTVQGIDTGVMGVITLTTLADPAFTT